MNSMKSNLFRRRLVLELVGNQIRMILSEVDVSSLLRSNETKQIHCARLVGVEVRENFVVFVCELFQRFLSFYRRIL